MLTDRNSRGRGVGRGAKLSRLLVAVGFALGIGVVMALAAGVTSSAAGAAPYSAAQVNETAAQD